MNSPYTCDNCIYNPSQFQELGTRTGFCLKHETILRNASHTTCKFNRRKDLPYFLVEEGQAEHAEEFAKTKGVVYYWTKYPEEFHKYSERHAWVTNTFDPLLNEVAIYHRSGKKWIFIEALAGSRNPIKSIMQSSLLRRYIFTCGPTEDNYRVLLAFTSTLGDEVNLRISDFRTEPSAEQFVEQKERYARDVILLRLYAIQEYGHLTENEQITWVSDELNGAFLTSSKEFTLAVKSFVPVLQSWIITAAEHRGTFFPNPKAAGY